MNILDLYITLYKDIENYDNFRAISINKSIKKETQGIKYIFISTKIAGIKIIVNAGYDVVIIPLDCFKSKIGTHIDDVKELSKYIKDFLMKGNV